MPSQSIVIASQRTASEVPIAIHSAHGGSHPGRWYRQKWISPPHEIAREWESERLGCAERTVREEDLKSKPPHHARNTALSSLAASGLADRRATAQERTRQPPSPPRTSNGRMRSATGSPGERMYERSSKNFSRPMSSTLGKTLGKSSESRAARSGSWPTGLRSGGPIQKSRGSRSSAPTKPSRCARTIVPPCWQSRMTPGSSPPRCSWTRTASSSTGANGIGRAIASFDALRDSNPPALRRRFFRRSASIGAESHHLRSLALRPLDFSAISRSCGQYRLSAKFGLSIRL